MPVYQGGPSAVHTPVTNWKNPKAGLKKGATAKKGKGGKKK